MAGFGCSDCTVANEREQAAVFFVGWKRAACCVARFWWLWRQEVSPRSGVVTFEGHGPALSGGDLESLLPSRELFATQWALCFVSVPFTLFFWLTLTLIFDHPLFFCVLYFFVFFLTCERFPYLHFFPSAGALPGKRLRLCAEC